MWHIETDFFISGFPDHVYQAIAGSGIAREENFLTTKVWIAHYGYEQAKASVLESMRKAKQIILIGYFCISHFQMQKLAEPDKAESAFPFISIRTW